MNTNDLSTAKDPDLRASLGALRRASRMARKTAIQTGTDLIVVRDGKLTRIPARALRESCGDAQESLEFSSRVREENAPTTDSP